MKTTFKILILSASVFFTAGATIAQTSIGSLLEPANGALLDLKEQDPDSNNVTSKSGGLLLPRVELEGIDNFSLLPVTTEQAKDHTGLLVYNVKTDASLSLEKGIYHWNGEKWKILNRITKTEGSTVKKMIYQGTGGHADSIVSLGIFEFRIYTTGSEPYPQFRLKSGVPIQTVHWQVNEYWDLDVSSESSGLSGSGYDFNLKNTTTPNVWTDCKNSMSSMERNEVWIADLQNDQIYQAQFIILKGGIGNTYVVIARKY